MMSGSATLAALMLPRMSAAETVPAKPEPGAIKLGSSPWIGGGPWEIAARKGQFKAQGLDDVKIVNFTLDTDMNAAFASGELQAGVLATHTAMNFVKAGIAVKIVLLMDISTTADAIISDGSVKSIADLRGKEVAFEEGSTSDILLNFALARNGMSIADIKKVPMPAADAGAALIAGRIPVAVTYEPYLSLARAQNPKVQMIYSANASPGLISDVLAVSADFADKKPGQVAALIRAWDAALADYKADTTAGRALIATAVGAKPEELSASFDGLKYYSVAENRAELGGRYLSDVIPEVAAAAQVAGLISGKVDMSKSIDTRFVDAKSN